MMKDLGKINFVTKGQHEFKRQKSCLTNLLEVYNKVTTVRQATGEWIDSVFRNYLKVFDTISGYTTGVHDDEYRLG